MTEEKSTVDELKEIDKQLKEGKKLKNSEFKKALTESTKLINNQFMDQWSKGEGSSRRKYNIDKVKQLLQSGIPENQIATSLGLYFKRSTIEEYLRVAHELIELEKSE